MQENGRWSGDPDGRSDSGSDRKTAYLRLLFERYHTALEQIVEIGARDEPPVQQVVQMQRRATAALSEDASPPRHLSDYAALHPMARGRSSGAERAGASEPPGEPVREIGPHPDTPVDA